MKPYTVDFELHINMPPWLQALSSFTPPVYRVYTDDELLVEREYDFYKTNQFVIERLNLYLEPGIHTVRIEQTTSAWSDVKLIMRNLMANNSDSQLTAIQDQSISFRSR